MDKTILGIDNGFDALDKSYLARCIKALKEMGAPLSGWECVDTIDVREDDPEAPLSECEVCGCDRVRYEHYMEHRHFPFQVMTGCICAGIMEGSILDAKERERKVKNRSARRRRFAEKEWKETIPGVYRRRYRHHEVTLYEHGGTFTVDVNGRRETRYKGRPITDLLSAGYAAFDMIDKREDLHA